MKTINREIVHPELYNIKEKYIFVYGSRRAGKSISMATIYCCLANDYPKSKLLVSRKTMPSLRITMMPMIIEALDEMEIPYTEDKTNHICHLYNGSKISFLPGYIGAKRDQRLFSTEWDFILWEESTEFTRGDFDMLFPALSGNRGRRQMFFLLNPPERSRHWIYKLYDEKKIKNEAHKIHFSLHDNPWLAEDIKQELNDLKETDIGLWRRFHEGEWGIDVVRDKVWTNIEVGRLEVVPQMWAGGVDFGWEHWTSSHLYAIDGKRIYMTEEVFGKHIDVFGLGKGIAKMVEKRGLALSEVPFYCDDSRPDLIRSLREQGIWAIPASQAKKSVEERLAFVRQFKIIIDSEKCPEGYEQVTNYIYPKDRDGNTMEKPLKLNDDTCDELGYMAFEHIPRGSFKYDEEETMREDIPQPEPIEMEEFAADLEEIG